jgi:AcrR family transcriptional regulator
MARAGVTPARVTEVAADVADREGWGTLTLASVAGELGVSVPSLYKHVDGLDGMRRLLALRSTDELATAVTGAVMGRAGRDALVPMCHAYRHFAQRHPGRYAATVRAPASDDVEHQAAAERVLAPVLAVIAGYALPASEQIHAARALRSGLHGFVVLELGGGFGLPEDVDASFDRLVASMDRSLGSWPTAAV